MHFHSFGGGRFAPRQRWGTLTAAAQRQLQDASARDWSSFTPRPDTGVTDGLKKRVKKTRKRCFWDRTSDLEDVLPYFKFLPPTFAQTSTQRKELV